MALRFTVPPNWPAPPAGWTPPPGWQPDPVWGPAPDGWQFWVDDEVQAAGGEGAVGSLGGSLGEAGAQAGFASVEEPTVPLGSAPYSSQGAGGVAGLDASSASAASVYSAQGHYSIRNQSAGNYDQPVFGSVQANPSAPKKSFFASTAGIITIIGVALVLIVGVIVAGVVLSSAGSSYSSDDSVAADSSEGSGSGSADVDTSGGFVPPEGSSNKQPEGDYKEYTGNGEATLDLEKPGGADKPAYLTYEFVGADEYADISIDSYDEDGEMTGLISYIPAENSAGSFWLDENGISGDSKPTTSLKVDGDGDWRVRVYPVESAPVYRSGDTVTGNGPAAFRLEGGAEAITVNETNTEYGFNLVVDEDMARGMVFSIMADEDYQGRVEIPAAETHYVVIDAAVDRGNWSITVD